ncbi:MAG: DNA repair protein RecN [Clostridia bacterium]|nr:DNA repair protein RecN [Clostridia bacterium]
MILCIHIENMAVIKSADIEFSDGFNVLTGETGAGKSILIDSINLLLGERTPRSVIRFGEQSASVSGLFAVPENHRKTFEELGIVPEEDGSVLLYREIFADGKNICRINGKIATVSVLKEVGKHLITIHGQHDNQIILDAKTHLDFLDLFAGTDASLIDIKSKYCKKYKELVLMQKELDELNIDEEEKLRRIDLLKYEIDELEKADLKEDEEEELKKRRDIIQGARELIKNVSASHEMLYAGDEVNAYSLLGRACDCIIDAQEIDPSLAEYADTLSEAMVNIEDVSRSLSRYIDSFDENGEGLDEIEARLDVIFKMKRKYGGSVSSAIKTYEKLTEEYDAIVMSDEKKEELTLEIKKLLKECALLSQKMSKIRKEAAPKLSSGINEALKYLDMQGAEFEVSFKETELCQKGTDDVEFLISTNTGEPKKPLGKIVSGGELSRIMLAIKSILPKSETEPAMIFDEIDTGVSGRAAQKIANKLAELSQKNQILCVTHLAQIAAGADTHFLIEKNEIDQKTYTTVTTLDHDGRINEIARIIGGDSVSDITKAQAEEMLRK